MEYKTTPEGDSLTARIEASIQKSIEGQRPNAWNFISRKTLDRIHTPVTSPKKLNPVADEVTIPDTATIPQEQTTEPTDTQDETALPEVKQMSNEEREEEGKRRFEAAVEKVSTLEPLSTLGTIEEALTDREYGVHDYFVLGEASTRGGEKSLGQLDSLRRYVLERTVMEKNHLSPERTNRLEAEMLSTLKGYLGVTEGHEISRQDRVFIERLNAYCGGSAFRGDGKHMIFPISPLVPDSSQGSRYDTRGNPLKFNFDE